MSDEGNYWRSIASKAKDMGTPVIQITPENHIPAEDWARILFIVGTMMRKVSETVGSDFVLDLVDNIPGEPDCNRSPDGYHETMEVTYDSAGKSPINSCIHCGKISRVTRKNKEQIQKHFEKIQAEMHTPF